MRLLETWDWLCSLTGTELFYLIAFWLGVAEFLYRIIQMELASRRKRSIQPSPAPTSRSTR